MTTPRIGHLPAAARRFLQWDTDPGAFGITMPFPVPAAMGADAARAMINALMDTHETLRSRYTFGPDAAWEILPASGGEIDQDRIDLRTVDISALADADFGVVIAAETAVNEARLDLESGRVVTAALFTRPAGGNILLLTVHHVACDAVALWVLWGDMTAYVSHWESGAPLALPPETTTSSEWAAFLTEHARTRLGELDYWWATCDPEPARTTRAETPDPVYLDAVIDGPRAARLFEELPAAFDATYTRILLVALGLAVEDVLGAARPIQVQKHGRYARLRPGTDLSRTVGWLSDDYPWLLAATTGSHAARMRHAMAEFPQAPEDFMLLRWYHPDLRARFETFRNPKFYFNFVGELGGHLPAARSRDMARLGSFDLAILLGGYRGEDGARVHYSVHSPTGGLGAERVNTIVAQWLSILDTVDTGLGTAHAAPTQ
ncbi:condensation domain-containing protein [Nocardia crassostreae]|uniref:condensation domain-containing protein n=1 Tax=Nocardia crassostreae TaxID=53428 RepID=UPI000836A3BD|nr:condensation domain-containing protein [Nocardia crassostreae]